MIFLGSLEILLSGLGLFVRVMDGVFNGVEGRLLITDEVVEESHGLVELTDVLFEGLEGLLAGFCVGKGVGEGGHGLMKRGRGLRV